MKILLVNPNSRKKGSVDEIPLITPPINLMYAAQVLMNRGFNIEIIDAFALNLSKEKILDTIRRKSPDIIGFPLYSNDLTMMHELTREIKELYGTKIFFAGHHVSALPHEAMVQFPNVDYLIRGEGEFLAADLMEAIDKESRLEKMKGISYRKKSRIIHNADSPPIEDLDMVPIPERKLIDTGLYYSKMSKRSSVDVLITSRGCPYKCTFCAKLNDTFRTYRQRSVRNVISELEMIRDAGIDAVE
ncbi:MAG: cobalamin-dependent protein, partial [Candidatus Woesearchaeota archaeon]|nr:cobalamin-dependent protein [Candidatus Woesearchaeota archaeon]